MLEKVRVKLCLCLFLLKENKTIYLYLNFPDFSTTTGWVLISYKAAKNKTFYDTKTHTILCIQLRSFFEQNYLLQIKIAVCKSHIILN